MVGNANYDTSLRITECNKYSSVWNLENLTRETARVTFTSLHIERWAFDVELIKIAEILKIPTSEVSVCWTEIDGSKLDPISASIQMFKDLFFLWLRYFVGVWRIVEKID